MADRDDAEKISAQQEISSSPSKGALSFPPHPPYSGMPPQKIAGKLRLQYLAILILILIGATLFGGKVLADLRQEQIEGDLSLTDKIIGSWVLYKDNTGVGAYVHANADGSIKLTEVRLGEWMITPHRLIEEEDAAYLEFYDTHTESWVRFIMITSDHEKELLLTYLE